MSYSSGIYYQFLLLLLWMPQLCVGQSVCRKTHSVTQAVCGDTVVLPCQFTGEDKQPRVTWQKKIAGDDLVVFEHPGEAIGSNQNILYHHRTGLQPEWHKKKNPSLTLKDVTTTDSGTYVCYIRLNPSLKSQICSEVSLEVNQGADVVRATPSQVTAKAGEELNLQWNFNPKCFNPTSCSCRRGSSDYLPAQSKGELTEELRAENCTVIPRVANGTVTRWVPGPNATQVGPYECCLGDHTTRLKGCVSFMVAGATSGAECTLGRYCQYFVTMLLLTIATIL
ncbi:uncharacterized protein [Heterodontus francisci]|uniref:uncharacterized protein isoform X2 n=1 Tax=Heterodontus francisci TaxID=7792 RepID=UPI00355B9CB5